MLDQLHHFLDCSVTYTSCCRETRPLTRRGLAVSFKTRSIQLPDYPIPTLICEIEAKNIHSGQRMPASVVMTYNDGVYVIDSAGRDGAEKNILIWMV